MKLPPLSLYIHIPWCVRKCPYCDLNSHAQKEELPVDAYIQALLDDLKADLDWVQGRKISTIFIGGGTPSLFSGEAIGRILNRITALTPCCYDFAVTREPTPGTVARDSIFTVPQHGVNRRLLCHTR